MSQALFTVAMPTTTAGAIAKPTANIRQNIGARAAPIRAGKFGAVPTNQRSAIVMSATPEKSQGIANSLKMDSSSILNNVAKNFQGIANQFNQMVNPQPYMQLAAPGFGSMPVYDASNFSTMKFENVNMSSNTPSALESNMLAGRSASVKKAPRSSTIMNAGPAVSGETDTKWGSKSEHMQKAMVAKMGINGFGRIGRLVFRSTFMDQADKARVVAINAPGKDLAYLKYLLEFDSVHGRFPGTVEIGDGCLIVNGEEVKVFGERDPANINWGSVDAEYICESTGVFLTKEKIQGHLDGGGKKVVFAAPAKDDSPTFVYGVNHETYDSTMQVVSNASCTTNCLAPLSKIIDDAFGIEEGLMTTVHATTASNVTVDGASAKDWRGGRANGPNIIPSSTGAAKAVGKVLPGLKGLLTGMAFRVPTTNVSVVDLTVKLKKEATWEDICKAVKDAEAGEMKGVVEFIDTPLVSQDFVSHAATCNFDADASIQLSPKFVKLIAWYDNEWAYSNQLVKLTHFMAEKDGALIERAMAGK